MAATVVLNESRQHPLQLPQLEKARELFALHQARDAAELRRVYLRLALQYHPDKHLEENRVAATQLFQAIAAAYEELLAKSDPHGEGHSRQRVKSPVAAAAELGDLEELRRLLEANPLLVNEVDDLGVFPLMFAAAGGCIAAVEMLLEFGADLHAQNPIKWSVLLYASLQHHPEMVRFLVGRGLSVTDHVLILAAYTGNPRSLEALLELYKGSVPNLRTEQSKKTLLHLACEGMCFLRHSAERHAECIELCLRWQIPVNATDPQTRRTCLQDYVGDVRWKTRGFENSLAHMGVLEKLCMAGAAVTAEDIEGNSALSLASSAGLTHVRQILFSYA